MELRAGYKETEVGVLPELWHVCPLRSVLSKSRLGGNYANQETEAEYPLIKMGNVARGYVDLSKLEFIVPGLTPEEQHRLVPGDVLFNTRNTLELVGKVAIWRSELPVAYYNSNLLRLEFDAEKICSNEYANCALNAGRSVAQLRALATGTTSVAAIYTRDLMGLLFVVPPKPEQRAIAETLSDVDGLLRELDRLIAKKRDLKQAVMQQLLTGQTRLPGFCGEWHEVRLGDLGAFLKGAGIKKDEAQSGELPCIRYGEIYTHHHDHIRSFTSWISRDVARCATRLQSGDLLFAASGETKEEIGKCVAFISSQEAYAGGDIVILRPLAVDAMFLGYLLNTPAVAAKKASCGQGDAVVHISAAALAKVQLSMPTLKEQVAIASVLRDIDLELQAVERRRDKIRNLKQAMMQELLTGRTRLL